MLGFRGASLYISHSFRESFRLECEAMKYVRDVLGLTNVLTLSGGYLFSLALKSDGTVWAWGHNQEGQLGNGSTTNSNVPVQVVGLTNIVAIAAGGFHGLAVRSAA